jgi:biogenesis of lysosome-related organelles complex 1 subunit 1
VTEELASAVNDGVAEVFNTQRVIESSARELQLQAAAFAKQTGRWSAMVGDFDKALKEVGDFENWVKARRLAAPSLARGSRCLSGDGVGPAGGGCVP